MDRLRGFLKNKKIDKHFKKSGHGARLGETSGTSAQGPSVSKEGNDRIAAADIAAHAAYKRLLSKEEPKMSYSQKKIQMMAKKELEEEKRKEGSPIEDELAKLGLEPRKVTDEQEFDHSNVIKGVFYTCELLSDDTALTKAELQIEIEEFLRDQLASCDDNDSMSAVILLLYTLNKSAVRLTAVETISKYLQNIAENPDEPKFRKIRMSNKAFQERVLSAKGGREVLEVIGFKEAQEGDPPEPFLIIPECLAIDTGRIVAALDILRDGQPVAIKVSRDTKAFIVPQNAHVPAPHLPPDFFDLNAEELAKEQRLRNEEVNRLTSLRTREMRERDARLRNYKYKYTLIRVRFPDRFVLQGTFDVYESLLAVREWIAANVAHPAMPFDLRHANAVLSDDRVALGDAGLAPCAVLHLVWSSPVHGPSLPDSLLATVQPLE